MQSLPCVVVGLEISVGVVQSSTIQYSNINCIDIGMLNFVQN